MRRPSSRSGKVSAGMLAEGRWEGEAGANVSARTHRHRQPIEVGGAGEGG